jgi:hypothetical protein
MNLRETTVREIIKSQKSRDKLEAKKPTCRLDVEDEFHFSAICP